MDYNSYRKNDMEAEREIASFLDQNLYSDKSLFTKAVRTDNIQNQIQGSDIIISVPSLGIEDGIVDEKASVYYINKDLRTFVLEISFLNRALQYSEGWFISDKETTEYYLMQWVRAEVDNPWNVKAKYITEIECILVSRNKLIEYFTREGYSKERLLEIAKWMRMNNRSMIAPMNKPYRFYYTNKLAEKPVNILLNKQEYIRLGEFHKIVKKNDNI